MTALAYIHRKLDYRKVQRITDMDTVKKILILYAILLNLTAAASELWDERIVNLRGVWKFNIGDNMKWADPNYDDSDWEDIYVP